MRRDSKKNSVVSEDSLLSDIVPFPEVNVYVVPVANVIRWNSLRILGSTAKVSPKKFLDRLAPDIGH